MALLSPGYEAKETTTQTTIIRGSTGRAAMVGKFTWGAVNRIPETKLNYMFGFQTMILLLILCRLLTFCKLVMI